MGCGFAKFSGIEMARYLAHPRSTQVRALMCANFAHSVVVRDAVAIVENLGTKTRTISCKNVYQLEV